MNELKELRKQICSDDGDARLKASDKLASIGGGKVLDILIPLLKSENAGIRNAAALSLREIGDNRSVKPLVKAITNPKNKNNRGTLVYALEKLDCSKLLSTLVELALCDSYEVQNHALTIISEQSFKTTKKEIIILRQMIKKYLKKKNKCQDYEILVNELERYLLRIEDEIKK